MSVVSINEDFDGESGSEDKTGRRVTRIFDVRVDTPTDNTITILNDRQSVPDKIPLVLEEHPDEPAIVVNSVIPSRRDPSNDRLNWRVSVNYLPKESGFELVDPNAEPGVVLPTDLPPVISYGFVPHSRPVTQAYGPGEPREAPTVPIQNSAGQPFNPTIEQEFDNLLIRIQRNEPTEDFFPQLLLEFRNTINDRGITVAGIELNPKEGLIREIPAVRRFDQEGSEYWEVAYEIEVDFTTHIREILDQGFYEVGPPLKAIPDDAGKDVTEPVNLNGFGLELVPPPAAVYLKFQTYFAADWDILDLPFDFTTED